MSSFSDESISRKEKLKSLMFDRILQVRRRAGLPTKLSEQEMQFVSNSLDRMIASGSGSENELLDIEFNLRKLNNRTSSSLNLPQNKDFLPTFFKKHENVVLTKSSNNHPTTKNESLPALHVPSVSTPPPQPHDVPTQKHEEAPSSINHQILSKPKRLKPISNNNKFADAWAKLTWKDVEDFQLEQQRKDAEKKFKLELQKQELDIQCGVKQHFKELEKQEDRQAFLRQLQTLDVLKREEAIQKEKKRKEMEAVRDAFLDQWRQSQAAKAEAVKTSIAAEKQELAEIRRSLRQDKRAKAQKLKKQAHEVEKQLKINEQQRKLKQEAIDKEMEEEKKLQKAMEEKLEKEEHQREENLKKLFSRQQKTLISLPESMFNGEKLAAIEQEKRALKEQAEIEAKTAKLLEEKEKQRRIRTNLVQLELEKQMKDKIEAHNQELAQKSKEKQEIEKYLLKIAEIEKKKRKEMEIKKRKELELLDRQLKEKYDENNHNNVNGFFDGKMSEQEILLNKKLLIRANAL